MNCHQILSGACNAGDRCFAVGSVEGVPFTVSIYIGQSPMGWMCMNYSLSVFFRLMRLGVISLYWPVRLNGCKSSLVRYTIIFESVVWIVQPTPVKLLLLMTIRYVSLSQPHWFAKIHLMQVHFFNINLHLVLFCPWHTHKQL